MKIELIKPRLARTITYRVQPIWRAPDAVCARAEWTLGTVNLQLFTLTNGDVLYEYFYRQRWYNIFAVADAAGNRKGWYCNLARPAEIADDGVRTIDCELDLVIAADRQLSLVLDEDEYAASGIAEHEPLVDQFLRAAIDELREDARHRRAAFDEEPLTGIARWHS